MLDCSPRCGPRLAVCRWHCWGDQRNAVSRSGALRTRPLFEAGQPGIDTRSIQAFMGARALPASWSTPRSRLNVSTAFGRTDADQQTRGRWGRGIRPVYLGVWCDYSSRTSRKSWSRFHRTRSAKASMVCVLSLPGEGRPLASSSAFRQSW